MNSQFAYLVQAVKQMQPGQDMEFSRDLFYWNAPNGWCAQDWILEQIVGSAYEFSYRQNPDTGNTIFRRRLKPCDSNHRTYVSPDRLHYVNKLGDGWYELKSANETP